MELRLLFSEDKSRLRAWRISGGSVPDCFFKVATTAGPTSSKSPCRPVVRIGCTSEFIDPLGHELDEIALAQAVGKMPADAALDDFAGKPPTPSVDPPPAHDPRLRRCSDAVGWRSRDRSTAHRCQAAYLARGPQSRCVLRQLSWRLSPAAAHARCRVRAGLPQASRTGIRLACWRRRCRSVRRFPRSA